jgi:hypothetical protein
MLSSATAHTRRNALSLDVDVARYTVYAPGLLVRVSAAASRNASLLMSADMCRLVVGTEWRHDMSFLQYCPPDYHADDVWRPR